MTTLLASSTRIDWLNQNFWAMAGVVLSTLISIISLVISLKPDRPKVKITEPVSDDIASNVQTKIKNPLFIYAINKGKTPAHIKQVGFQNRGDKRKKVSINDILGLSKIVPAKDTSVIEPNDSATYVLDHNVITTDSLERRNVWYRTYIVDALGKVTYSKWKLLPFPDKYQITWTFEHRVEHPLTASVNGDNGGLGMTLNQAFGAINDILRRYSDSVKADDVVIIEHHWELNWQNHIIDRPNEMTVDEFNKIAKVRLDI